MRRNINLGMRNQHMLFGVMTPLSVVANINSLELQAPAVAWREADWVKIKQLMEMNIKRARLM